MLYFLSCFHFRCTYLCISVYSDESVKCSIYNSTGIQIGDNNFMDVGGVNLPLLDSTYMNLKEEPASKYLDIFGNMPFEDPLSSNLELLLFVERDVVES